MLSRVFIGIFQKVEPTRMIRETEPSDCKVPS